MTGIVVNCQQRTLDWYAARCGVITASHASTLIKKGGKVSTGQGVRSYLDGLLAERITRHVDVPEWIKPAVQHGIDTEPRAREWYARESGETVREVGFVYRDDRRNAGCSPDGLTNSGRGVEIKCRQPKAHVGVLRTGEPPSDDWLQMQFSMWVTRLSVWDYVAYSTDPALSNLVVEVERDEKAIGTIALAVQDCIATLMSDLEHIAPHAASWPPQPGEITVTMPLDGVDTMPTETMEASEL